MKLMVVTLAAQVIIANRNKLNALTATSFHGTYRLTIGALSAEW